MGDDNPVPGAPSILTRVLDPGNPANDPKLLQTREAATSVQQWAQSTGSNNGGQDPAYITQMEEFGGISHQEIHDHAKQMQPGLIQASAEGWKAVADALLGNMMGLNSRVRQTVQRGWEGAAADAMLGTLDQFTKDMTALHNAVQSVASRIEAVGYGAEVVKAKIPPPPTPAATETTPNPLAIVNPAFATGQPGLENDLHQEAVWTMRNDYIPTYETAGQGVPTFVAPTPVDDAGTPPTTNPGTSPGGPGSNNPAAPDGSPDVGSPNEEAETQPTAVNPDTPATNSTTAQPDSSQDSSRNQSPANTTAASTPTTPGLAPGTPNSTPGVPSPSSPGVPSGPGSPSTNQAPPLAGKSLPPMAVPTTAAPNSPARAGTPGKAGSPGMMPHGAGQGRGKDDESEHKTPDYLVTKEHGEELIGPREATVPPVLGADNSEPSDGWSTDRERGGNR